VFGHHALRRDRRRGWVAGVCAGVAAALDTDPALVRTAVIVTGLFLPKLTLAAYLIAWLVLEEAPRR
jgi:phage shock protein PspC (stress-responsive transcriptional regulator)